MIYSVLHSGYYVLWLFLSTIAYHLGFSIYFQMKVFRVQCKVRTHIFYFFSATNFKHFMWVLFKASTVIPLLWTKINVIWFRVKCPIFALHAARKGNIRTVRGKCGFNCLQCQSSLGANESINTKTPNLKWGSREKKTWTFRKLDPFFKMTVLCFLQPIRMYSKWIHKEDTSFHHHLYLSKNYKEV